MPESIAKKKRVLVVDDETKFCKIVSEFLKGRDYEVVTASTGSEALKHMEHSPFEVILLDLVMPTISGLDLLKLIRSRPFPPRVIMVTATETPDAVQTAMREGAEAYMCKPVSLDALERLVSGFWPPQAPV